MSWRFDAIVVGRRASWPARIVRVTLAAASVVVIGLLDYASGIALSLSVFYFIPVAAVTVAVSPGAGFALSALAAIAWTLADALKSDWNPVVDLCNALFRFGALSFVVALLAALGRALREAQSSERRSKEFLAYAAHQLRTPVAGVRASAEALVLSSRTATAAQRERLASNITAEADRMGRLVGSLLRLARLDAGDPLERKPCDVAALLRREVDRLDVLAPHLAVRLDLPEPTPGRWLVDPAAVSEIVANLLDNARRHASSRVDVGLETSLSQVRILVRDDGGGLPVGGEERAFDRFVSLDGQGGSGLGLSIARSLAIAHGGGLAYVAGRFVVSLPAVVDDGDRSEVRERPASPMDVPVATTGRP